MAGPLPVDLLQLMASDFIFGQDTLKSLCLVSRIYNKIFTPELYRYVIIKDYHQYCGLEQLPIQRLAELSTERGLGFIRRLRLPRNLYKSDQWDALKQLLIRTTALEECTVKCSPADKFYFPSITGVCIEGSRLKINYSEWDLLPPYKNLRHLNLQSITSDPQRMAHSIALVLVNSPCLKSLGLDFHRHVCNQLSGLDFLTEVLVAFEKSHEHEKSLELEELSMGLLISNPDGPGYSSHALSRLTDLSKLKKFSHLNMEQDGYFTAQRDWLDLNYEILLQARNLESISAYICTKGLVSLVEELSNKRPRLLKDLKIHVIDRKRSYYPCYAPLTNLGGSWSKIHLGGIASQKDFSISEELSTGLFSESGDSIKDLGIHCVHWGTLHKEMAKYTNLHRMFIVHMSGMDTKFGTERARVIFDHHREKMRIQGLDSKLKYVGLGIERRVYTWMYPTGAQSGTTGSLANGWPHSTSAQRKQRDTDSYQVIELAPREAETFDFFVPGEL